MKRSYDAFARGDLEAVLGDMDQEIEWHQAQGLPHGGLYHGLDEVRRNIFDPLDDEWWDGFSAVPDEFLDAGEQVVVIGRYRAVGKHTGKQLTSRSSISGQCGAARRFGSVSILDTAGWVAALQI